MARKKTKISPVLSQDVVEPKKVDDYEVDAYNLVKSRMEGAKAINDTLKIRMASWQDMAMSRLDTSALDAYGRELNEARSHICLPIVENVIRALTAKYLVSLFIRQYFFILQGREIGDDELAKRLTELCKYTFTKMPKFFMNMVTFIQEFLKYGTTIGKLSWRKNVRKVRDDKGKISDVVEYEGVYFEPVHLENFFIDPQATNIDGFWKVHQSWKTTIELKSKNETYKKIHGKDLYKNLDKINAVYTQQQDGTYTITSDKNARGFPAQTNNLTEYNLNKLWEYWSEDNSRMIIVANEGLVIFDDVNPFRSGIHPFFSATYEPVEFEFYGRGVCEKLKPYHDEVQALNNEIIDNTKLVSRPMYKATMAFPLRQINSRCGKVILCPESINDLEPMPVPALPQDIHRLRDFLIQKIEETVGSQALMSSVGTPISKEQTATETAITNRLGNEFHALPMMLLEIPAFTEMVRKAYLIIQEFASDNYVQVITGKDDWKTVTKGELKDVDIIPRLNATVMSEEARVQFISTMLANLKDIPGLAPELIKLLMESAGELLGIHFDPSKMVAPQPQQSMPQQTASAVPPSGIGAVGAPQEPPMGGVPSA